MKTAALYIFMLLHVLPSMAQMCPGGGADFASAVSFDPAWIYGCNTGTSCNGGLTFDSKIACQPTTAMDACAPAPSCGNSSNNASNVWFKFFPTGPTAMISCFQNSSFVIGIQAFSGSTCGALTEIGCSLAGGPSSGVQLNLSGLQPGKLYYFRIFGSAGPVSQRTGIYCFCGTTGLSNIVLPIGFTGFGGKAVNGKINLMWMASSTDNNQSFEIERSQDGTLFTSIALIPETGNPDPRAYYYTDASPAGGINYYRLKHMLESGSYDYSDIIAVKRGLAKEFTFYFNPASKELQITAPDDITLTQSDISGRLLQIIHALPGSHYIPAGQLSSGIYFLRAVKSNQVQKFCVLKY
jgi:hypothetical protein